MNIVKSSFVKKLTAAMADRGYTPITVSLPMQTVYAFEKVINPDMRCQIIFRYMASPKAYDVSVGVDNILIRLDVEKTLEKFSILAGGLAYSSAVSPNACILFNADVFTKSNIGEVLPAKADQVELYLNILFANAVRPIFETVTDKQKLLQLLLRTDAPFNRGFYSRRVMYIAKLACMIQSDWAPIRAQLQKIENHLRNDAHIEKYPGPLIDDIYTHFSGIKGH